MDLNYFKLPWYKKLFYNLSKFFKNLGHEFIAFWRGLFKIIINFFVGCAKGIKEFGMNFYHGNVTTKISYLFLGVGHFFRGQKVRGILYFLLEVFFALYIALFGGKYLVMFLENMFSGGNVGRVETTDEFWNEEEGICGIVCNKEEADPYGIQKRALLKGCHENHKHGHRVGDGGILKEGHSSSVLMLAFIGKARNKRVCYGIDNLAKTGDYRHYRDKAEKLILR